MDNKEVIRPRRCARAMLVVLSGQGFELCNVIATMIMSIAHATWRVVAVAVSRGLILIRQPAEILHLVALESSR